jgi:RNA polymerase sigma-70 factor (ECF subfamily)
VAEDLLRAANAQGATGRYQIEAAIQSAHTARRLSGRDNWGAVAALYDHLLALTGSPVVALNRAIARAEADPEGRALVDALAALDALAEDRRMVDYQPYWAARGALLAKAGRRAEAAEALTLAAGLSTDEAVRQHLLARVREQQSGSIDRLDNNS